MSATDTSAPLPVDEKSSGVVLFLGIVLAVLGLLAVAYSVFFTLSTVIVIGAILMAAGVVELIHAFRSHRSTTGKVAFNVLSAIVYLVAGGIAVFNPVLGAISLTLIMSIFFIVEGVIRIWSAIVHRSTRNSGWFLFGGVIDLGLGILIASGWPVTGFWVIGLFVGIEMLFYGIAWIDLAARIRRTGSSGRSKPQMAA